jgi:ferric-dicitrate binding protein FerR (iron transport regulator)
MAVLRQIWFTHAPSELDEARVRRLIAERLGRFPGEAAGIGHDRVSRGARPWWRIPRLTPSGGPGSTTTPLLWMAAGAVVAIFGVVFVRPGQSVRSIPSATHEYSTATGQRATVELDDGSRIILAPRTQVIVSDDASHEGRLVTLVGEAHFEVVSHAHAPFLVRTGVVTTRVLGTTFDVRWYPGDAAGLVTVTSGKVMTQGRGAPATMTAGMMARFTDSSVVAMSVNTSMTYTDWTHGQLVFRKVPVPDALTTLTRWYGYHFRLGDPALATDSVTAVFTIGETGEMMQRLQHLLGVHMTFDDSVVTLRPGQAAQGGKGRFNTTHIPFSPSAEVGR